MKKNILTLLNLKELLGIVDRTTQTNLTINLTNIKNAYLHIIVENMGRLNYGSNMLDKKVSNFFYWMIKTL